MRWVGALASLVLLPAMAGCLGGIPADGDPVSSRDETGSQTRTTPAPTPPVPPGGAPRLAATLTPLGTGFVANLSAYNPGPQPYTTSIAYSCASSGYGSWTATLAGPPGEALDYQPPGTTELSCSGTTAHPVPPGQWHNWTFHGDWGSASCRTRGVCDNWWDGDLTTGGTRSRAPPGDYTWTFTFRYRAGDDPAWRSEPIDVLVRLP